MSVTTTLQAPVRSARTAAAAEALTAYTSSNPDPIDPAVGRTMLALRAERKAAGEEDGTWFWELAESFEVTAADYDERALTWPEYSAKAAERRAWAAEERAKALEIAAGPAPAMKVAA